MCNERKSQSTRQIGMPVPRHVPSEVERYKRSTLYVLHLFEVSASVSAGSRGLYRSQPANRNTGHDGT